MTLLCAIAFHAGDSRLARALLRFIADLGGVSEHDCLLVADHDTPWDDCMDCADSARKAFKSVELVTNGAHVEGWIPGSDSLFKTAAQHCAGRPFFFLEADACPLKPGWMDALEVEYARCGRPFMGALIHHQTPGWPNPYLEGCAVYPADAWARMEPHWDMAHSWTKACSAAVVPNAVNTALIHHCWGPKRDLSPTFSEKNVPYTNVFCLKGLRQEAVVFHRCKDDSLMTLLRAQHHLPPAPFKVNGHVVANRPSSGSRFVSLRRAGDIIALLPILRHMANKGRNVELVVASDFMPLMDSVSYVKPIEWKGGWEEPLSAARSFGAINAQVFGRGVPVPRTPANFVTEAWKRVGYQWNRYLPLELDNRNPEREERLAESVFKTDKPKILVKLHGFSSPFPHGPFVWEKLRGQFADSVELVDMDAVKAEQVYDLLGLMDRADCLISSDTVTLHLNRSHRIPTVALVNDSPWGSSPMVGNVVARIPYSQVPARWTEAALAIRIACSRTTVTPSIALTYSDWPIKDPQTRRRHDSAFATWPILGARLVPCRAGEGRDSSNIRDPHRMPYLHDMIGKALSTGLESIIAVSNNDVWFEPKLLNAVHASCEKYGCYWAHRLDRPGGVTDNGVDFVAFTRNWWALHKKYLPDFIFGSIWWDDLISRIMMWSGCEEQERLYWHEPHPSAMTVRYKAPHMLHAEQLARQWTRAYGEPHMKPIDLLNSL